MAGCCNSLTEATIIAVKTLTVATVASLLQVICSAEAILKRSSLICPQMCFLCFQYSHWRCATATKVLTNLPVAVVTMTTGTAAEYHCDGSWVLLWHHSGDSQSSGGRSGSDDVWNYSRTLLGLGMDGWTSGAIACQLPLPFRILCSVCVG